ncbi:MAG: ammonium transporter [Actinomycetota bacterium]|nr:ammonium transporter [Actinomycetota bacterium]
MNFEKGVSMDYSNLLDILWILIAAFLVFSMHAGFTLVETGFTRAKNTVNIIMKNFMTVVLGLLLFFFIGYGLMFGKSAGGFIGTDNFLVSLTDSADTKNFAIWLFQAVFAATAATIVSGAMAERTKFHSYLIFCIVITAFIYPVVGHWVWGGGWLQEMGMIDFAGSNVVHSVGGFSALAGALVLGPRYGKYSIDGKSNAIPGHNIPLAALGVLILWFGWFGFNPGSTLSASSPAIAPVAVNTALAGASGALGALAYVWIRYRKPDASMVLNGALAGLVGITASCAVVSPVSALIIGFIAGILVVISVDFFDKILKIDDPVGAISVHGVCGVFGTLAVGLFAQSDYASLAGFGAMNGLFYGGGWHQLLVQFIGSISTIAWSFTSMFILFTVMKYTIGLRVSRETELKGLDIEEHGMEAYSGFQIFNNE